MNIFDDENPAARDENAYAEQITALFSITYAQKKNAVNRATNEFTMEAPVHFTCVCCMSLVYEPVMCKCGNALYCKSCALTAIEKNPNMRCRCGQKLELVPMPPLMTKMLNQERVVCQLPNCCLNKSAIPYEELCDHIDKCLVLDTNPVCPIGCGEEIKSKDHGLFHYKYCKNAYITCFLCNEEITRGSNENHIKRHFEEKQQHINCCEARLFKEEDANATLQKQNDQYLDKIAKLEERINNIRKENQKQEAKYQELIKKAEEKNAYDDVDYEGEYEEYDDDEEYDEYDIDLFSGKNGGGGGQKNA